MKKSGLAFFLFLSFVSLIGSAQVNVDTAASKISYLNNSGDGNPETRKIYKRKGNLYYAWGYNIAAFTKSDIRFWGNGYDFTITNVTATGHFHYDFLTYVKLNTFTIPQYNSRIGYFLSDKSFVTFGHDHMKYALNRQATLLTGTINSGPNYGTYSNTEVLVGDNAESGNYQSSLLDSLPHGFVSEFEHCDGLNDFSFEYGRLEQLWIAKNGKHAFSFQGTIGAGMVIPDTDADILEYEARHNNVGHGKKSFHLAGYSLSASIGLQFDLFQHFFILGKLKGGYINLPDIRTTTEGGKASQHFGFVEPIVMIGYSHSICKK